VQAYFGPAHRRKSAEAEAFLSKWHKQAPAKGWSSNVVLYLLKAITDSELLATSDVILKQTSAHTYIGFDALLSGDKKKSRNASSMGRR
jgi:hypothetical protein